MAMPFLFFSIPALAIALSYEVHFIGLQDEAALKAMREASELVSLQSRPPASINGLRYRIAADIPSLIRILHAYAYYDAEVSSNIETEQGVVQVYLHIHPGPQYALSSYQVFRGDCSQFAEIPFCPSLSPEQLGLRIGDPALSFDIVNAELQILTELSRCGYPLAQIDKRKVIVDMAEKRVEAAACVQQGPASKFGPTTLFGLRNIQPRFIERKIAWSEGETYNSDLIEKTQARLLKTELFSSVLVTHGEELDAAGEMPIKMRMTEARHRRVGLGAFYATVDGPGLSFSWSNRNIRGMGEILSMKGDFSKRYIAGNLTYKKPDFLSFDQTYRAVFEVSREKIRAYLAFSYRLANYIERIVDPKRTFSAGLKFEQISIKKSAENGTFLLLGLPLFGRYDTSNDLLDPTTGYTLVYSMTPYQSIENPEQRFAKQRFTATFYIPLTLKRKIVLALRTQVGSIAGVRQRHVPLTKLFLGGSEDDLRGYRYKTVSPLDAHRKPLGGRSAIFATAELRLRVMEKVGVVSFADVGTVDFSEIPRLRERWFKSLGAGLRYYAFFGPLRFDIGFPLDRRRGIDPKFQIYASIGQTF